MNNNIGRFSGWLIITLICVAYAPVAGEYMLRFFDVPSLELWDRFYALVVGEQQALGAGSVRVVQHGVYEASRWPMLVHTALGGLVILLVASQFARPLRQRFPGVHRRVGRLVMPMGTVSMLAAGVYLVKTGPQATFSGPAFYAQLWALTVFTLVALWLGFVAIRRREILLHQCLMIYAFALLLTAPLLRVGWLGLGLIWPDVTQEYLNVAAGIILGFVAPGGAVVVAMLTALRRPLSGVPHSALQDQAGSRAAWLSGLLSLVSLCLLAVFYQRYLGHADRILTTAMMTGALTFATFGVLALVARRRGLVLEAQEWRIHSNAVLASLPLGIGLWSMFVAFFTPPQAFYAMTLTAPAVAISSGFALVLWRRWRLQYAGAAADIATRLGRAPGWR